MSQEDSDNLSLIESRRANQAESHVVDGRAKRHVENAFQVNKKKGNGVHVAATKGTEGNGLKLFSLCLYRPPATVPTGKYSAKWTFADKEENKIFRLVFLFVSAHF